MSSIHIPVLKGDLIGQDLAPLALDFAREAGANIQWTFIDHVLDEDGQLVKQCKEILSQHQVALKGPFSTPKGVGQLGASVALRKELQLFAGVRHIKNLPGLPSRYSDLDLVVIRENTEDVYAGLEHEVYPGVVESIKVVTQEASDRIFEFAFEFAQRQNRKKVSIIHKANIMKQSDGLFLKVGQNWAKKYPEIETRGLIVDNTCMQMVQYPEQFDILVCGNLYGDILSDLGAGLVGGISATWGVDRGHELALFEAIHGRVPELIGTDMANPLPMIMPLIALLKEVGQNQAADRMYSAITYVLKAGQFLTQDLGGTAKTSEMMKALNQAL